MSRRELLIHDYAVQYARLNPGLKSCLLPERTAASLQLMYGPLLAQLHAGSRILDLGCGAGVFLSWLRRWPGVIPVGVDGSASQVAQARHNLPNIEITCADGLSYLREHPNSFSGIFCTDVLEHLPSVDRCLEWIEVAQTALVAGGFFFCRVPNAANLAASYFRYIDLTHERSFTSISLLQLLETGGLRQCRTVPIRAAHLTGRLRIGLEAMLHRIVFRVCGNSAESLFTHDVCAIGYRDGQGRQV